MEKNHRPALQLEVRELERRSKPGCQTSTTSSLCTCPITLTTGCAL